MPADTKKIKKFIRFGLPNIKQPPKRTTHAQLLEWARKLSDNDKTFVRRMLACLNIRGYIKRDDKLIYALWTKRDKEASKIRSRNRRLFLKLGLVKVGDGKHIHHRDGNVFNNSMSNLMIVDGTKHKKAHTNLDAEAVCSRFLHRLKKLKLI